MTKTKTTKRALIASVLSLLLCVSMLIGSTFAWFTDTATTGVNTIQAGKLDIAFMMADGKNEDNSTKWVTAEGKTLNFTNVDGETDILWEPGATFTLPAVKLVNNGNLALKFKLFVNGLSDGDMKLAEVLQVKINGEFMYADAAKTTIVTLKDILNSTDADGFAHGVILPAGETDPKDGYTTVGESAEYTIALHMMESANNDYQGLTLGGISLTAYATQYIYEEDMTDNQYDKDATWNNGNYQIPGAPAGVEINLVKKDATSADGKKSSIVVYDAASLMWVFENKDTIANSLVKQVGTWSEVYLWFPEWTLKLGDDIDFAGATIDPLVPWFSNFDGDGHSISNVNLATTKYDATGYQTSFFLIKDMHMNISNVTFRNITATSSEKNVWMGIVVGQSFGDAEIKDVVVDGFTLTATGEAATSAYIGGLTANCSTNITGCTVKNGTIVGGKNVGGIVGFVNAEGDDVVISNCKADGVTISAPNKDDRTTVAQLFGRLSTPNGNITVTGCTATNVVAGAGESIEPVANIYGDLGNTTGTVTIDGTTQTKS